MGYLFLLTQEEDMIISKGLRAPGEAFRFPVLLTLSSLYFELSLPL